jgi:hypothetical protein
MPSVIFAFRCFSDRVACFCPVWPQPTILLYLHLLSSWDYRYVPCLEVRNLGATWLGGPGMRCLMRLQLAVDWRCNHLKTRMGLEDLLSGEHPNMASWFRLPAGKLSSFLHRPLHRMLECSGDLVTGLLQSKYSKQTKQKPQCLYDSPWKLYIITSAIFYWSHWPGMTQCEMDLLRGTNTGSENHWHYLLKKTKTLN